MRVPGSSWLIRVKDAAGHQRLGHPPDRHPDQENLEQALARGEASKRLPALPRAAAHHRRDRSGFIRPAYSAQLHSGLEARVGEQRVDYVKKRGGCFTHYSPVIADVLCFFKFTDRPVFPDLRVSLLDKHALVRTTGTISNWSFAIFQVKPKSSGIC